MTTNEWNNTTTPKQWPSWPSKSMGSADWINGVISVMNSTCNAIIKKIIGLSWTQCPYSSSATAPKCRDSRHCTRITGSALSGRMCWIYTTHAHASLFFRVIEPTDLCSISWSASTSANNGDGIGVYILHMSVIVSWLPSYTWLERENTDVFSCVKQLKMTKVHTTYRKVLNLLIFRTLFLLKKSKSTCAKNMDYYADDSLAS
jgi:hypothetical protein